MVLSDRWDEASVSPQLDAMLPILETYTRRPQELSFDQMRPVLELLGRADVEKALLVAAAFAAMNRMVDAFGADLSPEQAPSLGAMLSMVGRISDRKGKPRKQDGPKQPQCIQDLRGKVVGEQGDAPQAIRVAVEACVVRDTGGTRPRLELPQVVEDLVLTVGRNAHEVKDAHFEALTAAGWSEESQYEMVFSAAASAAIARQEMAWLALGHASIDSA